MHHAIDAVATLPLEWQWGLGRLPGRRSPTIAVDGDLATLATAKVATLWAFVISS